MTTELDGFVQLDRQFRPFTESYPPDQAGSDSYLVAALASRDAFDWSKLLEERLAVVLGEPGSGKSREFRAQCGRVRERGDLAFFLELGQLTRSPIEACLTSVELSQFRKWKKGRAAAWFFLDSVDEAKLLRQSDFYAALTRLADGVGSVALIRAHIIISSRISEWQPETDRGEVLARLRTRRSSAKPADSEKGADTDAESLTAVQIEPLDAGRVRLLAIAKGSGDAETFLKEIDERRAWEFARRPLDVIELLEFWHANGRIGSLTEIIEHDVTTKLKETTLRRTPRDLSKRMARDGAEQLAAATLLCKQPQFKVPDDAFIGIDAIDASAVLPDTWKYTDVATLLSRPLFDSATYGRIRFHHRRVAEYLAAKWLANRVIVDGCPTRTLMELLFEHSRESLAPRQSLIPVIAWLCACEGKWADDVRAAVERSCPEIAFEFGDPRALGLEFRRRLLRAWVERQAGRKDVWVPYEPAALQRLADPALADDISKYLSTEATPLGVREHLVQIVRHGRLTACLPQLIDILASTSTPQSLKTYVLAALRDMGTAETRQQAWNILQDERRLSGDLCALACEALYPSVLGPSELGELLVKIDEAGDRASHFALRIEGHLGEVLDASVSGSVLRELNRLVQMSPFVSLEKRETRISAKHLHLLDVIPTVLLKLLSGDFLSPTDIDAAAEAGTLLAEAGDFHFYHDDSFGELDTAYKRHPKARRATFWRKVGHFRLDHPSEPVEFWRLVRYRDVMSLENGDIAWLAADIADSQCHDDRAVALQVALRLAPNVSQLQNLERAAADDISLTSDLRNERRRRRWWRLKRLWYVVTNRDLWKSRSSKLGYRISRLRKSFLTWWRLFRNKSLLRSGRPLPLLADLSHDMPKRGILWRSIGLAVQDGCKRVSREHTPLLPHARPEPNSVSWVVPVGLAGIQAAIEDGELSFGSLSDADADHLARYAVNELSGFPDWLEELARVRPSAVGRVLAECVRGEWKYPADRASANDVLSKLNWEGAVLAGLARASIIEQLRAGDPPHARVLENGLSLLLKTSPAPLEELAELSIDRCSIVPVESAAFTLWSAVAFKVAAAQSIAVIDDRLGSAEHAEAVMVGICSMLDDHMRGGLPAVRTPYAQATALRSLIMLVFKSVRRDQDIVRRSGEVYSPVARDAAQSFRDGLLRRLADSDDPDAAGQLRTLLADSNLAAHRDYILHLLDQRLVRDAEVAAWRPREVREFREEFEVDPKTDRDLFRIIVNRLNDIKDGVERSDISNREDVHKDSNEHRLRRFLALHLSASARGRYTIPQEGEVDPRERPDLRAENPRTKPVPIEVKWAQNWTLPKLLEGLEEQLVGKYLRAETTRHGVYVLGMHYDRRYWEGANGERLSFERLLELLRLRAKDIVATNPHVEQLEIISIDFRVPTIG